MRSWPLIRARSTVELPVNPGPTDTGWGIGDMDPKPSMPPGRWGEPDV